MPKIYIATDHAGFPLKETLKVFLLSEGYEVEDCGAYTFVSNDDYPDLIRPCAERVASDTGSFGIVIGASGQGEAMAANKVKGVRAMVYYGKVERAQTDADGNQYDVITSGRVHNDANVISLGAKFMNVEDAKQAVQLFLKTSKSTEERHARRREKID
jgi:ribose 5-phosphate isomerase B